MQNETLKANIIERLLSRSRIDENGCWIWTGAIDRYGYGKIKKYWGKQVKVHRLAYEVFIGLPIDHVLHKPICKSKACFNPEHLYEGTHSDNMRDSVKAGTHNSREHPYGRGWIK